MRTRDRNQVEEQQARTPGEATPTGGDSQGGEEIRRRARRLLELGDETITNALSRNSERFLDQNRQQGGQ